MDGMHFLLIGLVGGLLAAMALFGRTQVILQQERSQDGAERSGCGGALAGALVLVLLVIYLGQA